MTRIQQPLDMQQLAAMKQMQANQKRGELYGLACTLFKEKWQPTMNDVTFAKRCLDAAKEMFSTLDEEEKKHGSKT